MAQSAVQTLGKYQILERIATGGMAEIYKARTEGIGGFHRTFAIKRILPHLSHHTDYIAMLVEEAKVAGLLSHANIVQILDLGQEHDVWYIAMEYVDGRDLGAVLKRAKERGLCLPVPHSVYIAIELLKGLEYAHQRQVMRGGRAVPLHIVHRDVSPPNLLLSFEGEVKLTDFGIARAADKLLDTEAGLIQGHFDYMSPEQAEGRPGLDPRSDLFSAGIVLYEMLTGEHPFRAGTEFATMERIRQGGYTPASQLNPEIPRALDAILARALRTECAERYPSATAFKEALDRFFQDSGFIFTHSTLAAYLRGLFPELKPPLPTSASAQPDPGPDPTWRSAPGPDDLELPDAERSVRQAATPSRLIDAASHAPRGVPRRGFAGLAFVLGAVVGAAALGMAAQSASIAALLLPDAPATLRIEAPADAKTTVNGQGFSGEAAVPVNESQRIEVQLPGRDAWERTVTLRAGEHRVLIVLPPPQTSPGTPVGEP